MKNPITQYFKWADTLPRNFFGFTMMFLVPLFTGIALCVGFANGTYYTIVNWNYKEQATKHCYESGVYPGAYVISTKQIGKKVNPHFDTGVVMEVRPETFIVEFDEMGEQEVGEDGFEVKTRSEVEAYRLSLVNPPPKSETVPVNSDTRIAFHDLRNHKHIHNSERAQEVFMRLMRYYEKKDKSKISVSLPKTPVVQQSVLVTTNPYTLSQGL